MFYKGLYSPVSPEGKVCLYDSLGEKLHLTKPYDIYFNNHKNQDSVIYISPHIAEHDVRFTVSPDSIRTIHLPFGEPYRIDSYKNKVARQIYLTEEQMMNTVLYVPYGCADNYNIPEYKWFKEIREDSWAERYIAPLRTYLKGHSWKNGVNILVVSFLLVLLINAILCRKIKTGRLALIFKRSLRMWAHYLPWIILPFIGAVYLAIGLGKSPQQADGIGYIVTYVTIAFVVFSPQIIRFVSRIFNRYVIDPLALLFH